MNDTFRLVIALSRNDVEPGESHPAELLLENGLKSGSIAPEDLKSIVFDHLLDRTVLQNLLYCLGHIEEKTAGAVGKAVVHRMLRYPDFGVQERAVGALEHWESWESLRMLEDCRFSDKMLEDYRKGVANDIREELEESYG